VQSPSLLAVHIVQGLVDEDGDAVEGQSPGGSRLVEGGEAGEDEGADYVGEEADDGDSVGGDCFGGDFEDQFGQGGPDVLVGDGKVAASVLELSDSLLSFLRDVVHR
jgi:hypothetical protein